MKLILFATVRFFYYCNFTKKANSHFLKVEIQTKPKLWLFGDFVLKAKLFLCKKNVVSVTGLERSYVKIFIRVTDISITKTEVSVTGTVRPFI